MPSIGEVLQQGWQVHQSGNVPAAMQLYRGVLAQIPNSAEAWVYLGIAQFDLRDFAGSIESYRRALEIKSQFPIAWNNLGNSLRMRGEIDEAEQCFAKALDLQPGYLSALKNRGTLWVWNGDVERGLQWYARGLEIDPNNAELHRNLGVISLLMGDYRRGFEEFRWRWRMPGVARSAVTEAWRATGIHVPVWTGQSLENRVVVIYPEQGLGDAIHFIRVAAALKAGGATVIVTCSEKLIPLFSSAPGIDEFVAEVVPADRGGDVLAAGMSMLHGSMTQADYQGSFLEILDGLYQRDQTMYFGESLFQGDAAQVASSNPSRVPGYLNVSDTAIGKWADWLTSARASASQTGDALAKPIIGINWQGNREHHADVYRSVELEVLRPIVESGEFDVVNMQFGHGIEQLDQVDFSDSIIRLPETLDQSTGQFMDTAAVLCNLDAIVTTDTAIAHLAGALGVRTHLLLGRVPDWRWLMSGVSTAWYPNTVISRQSEFGNWAEPVHRIKDRLLA
ncbi:tetratricopeptide repeat protein [Aporhodopirellula aestuarii]|uniref:Tetratricopeptide repeat-containing glycosyltransferase family protein n=1 Tax=Aporhodopirellula aestuarii TaxID=2950107 RepID=A0ABT0UB06_9BACT|nr:tetratricopeptide repeat-containing glycosyltransferase family protein [Aporhodopirellula aestuarii]MCM2374085.1 tetratricopeptide repeat-containing glycosyltransferase family protein [Aporhodopirellula aestuarii]